MRIPLRKSVGVLNVGLYAVALHVVLGVQGVDQVEPVSRVGDGVAAGVPHLVFSRLFLDMFRFVGHSRLDVVMLCTMVAHELETHHIRCQIVAGMFHVGTHAEVLLRLCVVEPVLPHDVIAFTLFGVESRCQKFYGCMLVEMSSDAGCSEEGTEHILFLTVEVHLERLHVCQCSEFGLTVFGLEVIMIFRDVSDEINRPSFIRFVTDMRLIINKIWLILSSCFQGAQEIARRLVSDTMTHGESAVAVADESAGAQERSRD